MSDKNAQVPESKPSDKVSKRRRVDARIPLSWQSMRHEVEAIRDYIETVDSAFKGRSKDFEAWASKRAAKLPEHAKGGFYEDEAQTAFNLTRHFPEFAWETTFVAIYSFLENEMLGIARIVGRRLRIRLDPDDLRDKGIHAAKKYLEDLCGIAFPEGKHPWQEALHYNRVRNAIVHSGGRLKRAKHLTKIQNYLQGKKSLTIDSFNRLELSKEFCLEVLDNVEALLDDLFKLARKRVS